MRMRRAAGRICRGMKRGGRKWIPLARVGEQKRYYCLWLKHNAEVAEEQIKEKDSDVGERTNKILTRAEGNK
jgi:hypothetical protein